MRRVGRWGRTARAACFSSQPRPYNFKGDNAVGMLPQVLEAINSVSSAPTTTEWSGYGDDPATRTMHAVVSDFFDHTAPLTVRATVTGTAANDMLLHALVRLNGGDEMGAVLCSESAHCFTDELSLGGGVKLIPIASQQGDAKITAEQVHGAMDRYAKVMFGGIHVLSISQCTESGTVYTSSELGAICRAAHERGLLVHMDGARFLNAVAHLDNECSPADLSWRAGVDALSLGGSKSGAFVDAAVLFGSAHEAAGRMGVYAKQRGHACSKAR